MPAVRPDAPDVAARPQVLLDAVGRRQAEAVIRLIRAVLDGNVIGAYLHGSAVLGGLRKGSDLDIVAVVRRRTTIAERRRLVDGLLPISGKRARPPARPVELIIVRQSAVRPWRYPPRSEFLYGEWLRDDYERGFTPPSERSPDLAPVITMVLAGDHPLFGPPPAELLDPVPPADLRRGVVSGIPGLMAELDTDTTNVLLTLARIWVTVATSAILSKDDAAGWALKRLAEPHRPVFIRARAIYLGEIEEHWADLEARIHPAADVVVGEIARLA
ncbi:MAG: aminoglycoside adenylyltransferase domain-containing protein [Candidatus Limnocylindrales bacterium]